MNTVRHFIATELFYIRTACHLQGDYVVLASEGHCLCGVDVAAPQQLRRGPQQPLLTYLESFRRQFTTYEVLIIVYSRVAAVGAAIAAAIHPHGSINGIQSLN